MTATELSCGHESLHSQSWDPGSSGPCDTEGARPHGGHQALSPAALPSLYLLSLLSCWAQVLRLPLQHQMLLPGLPPCHGFPTSPSPPPPGPQHAHISLEELAPPRPPGSTAHSLVQGMRLQVSQSLRGPWHCREKQEPGPPSLPLSTRQATQVGGTRWACPAV